ncbi:hypothetical protein [Promicromonospora sp. NPDC050880]|uniref:hypothetical protein n=1 Tax=Promicromonospora sp. NPDC050880 TaxID=3364406 RepID=UPI0037BA3EBA
MSPMDALALLALVSLVYVLVRGTVAGVRHALRVERRYLEMLRADEAGGAGRQPRRCPYCNGWFNTAREQAAHERDCDQKPAQLVADRLPTPLEVLDLAFPPYPPPDRPDWRFSYFAVGLVDETRRGVLGTWTEA